MGLRDLMKRKKSTQVDAELVGGLTDTDWEANLQTGFGVEQEPDEHQDSQESSSAWQGFSGSAGQAEEEEEEQASLVSSLDIFTAETGEDTEGNKLAAQLPAVDIHDLMRECREIASALRR